jgi:hypothetical protein
MYQYITGNKYEEEEINEMYVCKKEDLCVDIEIFDRMNCILI